MKENGILLNELLVVVNGNAILDSIVVLLHLLEQSLLVYFGYKGAHLEGLLVRIGLLTILDGRI